MKIKWSIPRKFRESENNKKNENQNQDMLRVNLSSLAATFHLIWQSPSPSLPRQLRPCQPALRKNREETDEESMQTVQDLSPTWSLPSRFTKLKSLFCCLIWRWGVQVCLTHEFSNLELAGNNDVVGLLEDLGTHRGHGYSSGRIPSDWQLFAAGRLWGEWEKGWGFSSHYIYKIPQPKKKKWIEKQRYVTGSNGLNVLHANNTL